MGILSLLVGPITTLLGKIIPDPNLRAQAQLKMMELQSQGELADLDAKLKDDLAAAGIVQAEASSGHWLTSSWRPITMLVFVALICCRIFGLTSVHVPDAEYAQLWELVKIGLGGYVIGRSAEKIAGPVVSAVTQAVKK